MANSQRWVRRLLYLITGGAGFIGSHLAWSLAKRGESVRLLDNFDTGSRDTVDVLQTAFPRQVSIMEGDVRDLGNCRQACTGADYVLHHAAVASVQRSIANPEECADVNIRGTVNILSAAKASGSVRRLVYASSSAVYGDLPGRSKKESDRLEPLSPYATSKLAGEHFCRNYARLMELETVSFRYFNVYGERQSPAGSYAAVIPKFIEAIASSQQPIVYGDGKHVRDFVYVGDVVHANIDACLASPESVAGRVFNIAGGIGITLNSLLGELSRVVGRHVVARQEAPRPGDIRRSVANIQLAAQFLNYRPHVGIREGLERMISAHSGFARK